MKTLTAEKLLRHIDSGYGWCTMDYFKETCEESEDVYMSFLNELFINNKIKIVTVKQVFDDKLNLQEFDDLVDDINFYAFNLIIIT